MINTIKVYIIGALVILTVSALNDTNLDLLVKWIGGGLK